MIRGFRCDETKRIFGGKVSRSFPADIQTTARRKLRMLNRAQRLQDLRDPPGNRLEPLKGDLAGWWSIRVNDQWRVCFRWADGNAHDVAIKDYH